MAELERDLPKLPDPPVIRDRLPVLSERSKRLVAAIIATATVGLTIKAYQNTAPSSETRVEPAKAAPKDEKPSPWRTYLNDGGIESQDAFDIYDNPFDPDTNVTSGVITSEHDTKGHKPE